MSELICVTFVNKAGSNNVGWSGEKLLTFSPITGVSQINDIGWHDLYQLLVSAGYSGTAEELRAKGFIHTKSSVVFIDLWSGSRLGIFLVPVLPDSGGNIVSTESHGYTKICDSKVTIGGVSYNLYPESWDDDYLYMSVWNASESTQLGMGRVRWSDGNIDISLFSSCYRDYYRVIPELWRSGDSYRALVASTATAVRICGASNEFSFGGSISRDTSRSIPSGNTRSYGLAGLFYGYSPVTPLKWSDAYYPCIEVRNYIASASGFTCDYVKKADDYDPSLGGTFSRLISVTNAVFEKGSNNIYTEISNVQSSPLIYTELSALQDPAGSPGYLYGVRSYFGDFPPTNVEPMTFWTLHKQTRETL